MAATNTSSQLPPLDPPVSADELAAKAANKRFEGLVVVRNKAVKGKGAWYWAYLEPVLVYNTDNGLPKAVKLRCSLCDALFSASNPSRTASEHLKRGTCPNFSSLPKPISSLSPSGPSSAPIPTPPPPSLHNHRKRNSSSASSRYQISPLAIVDPSRFPPDYTSTTATTAAHQPHLLLSGGKDDLGPLARFEDSVKKLKSPNTTSSPAPILSKSQIDSAIDSLADWVYDSCGGVSFSSLEHSKFRAFLSQVGLPAVSRRDFTGARLDIRFQEARAESEARIRDAMFFQIASDGWNYKGISGEDSLVNLTVNLPNGSSLYRSGIFISGSVPSNYAEEVFLETITGIVGNNVRQCVGIVADKFKAKALINLENQNPWMVNLSCQFQGFSDLIKDLAKELPLFKSAAENCLKVATFVNDNVRIRKIFQKYQEQEYGYCKMIQIPPHVHQNPNFESVNVMMEDILNSAQALQLVLVDNGIAMDNVVAAEAVDMIRDTGFWTEVEAVHSLVKLVKDMAREVEVERPLVGHCLRLWNELRLKVKEWCSKYQISEGSLEKIIERRFRKNYHPAWAAAFILDPLYLIRDSSGKYLPPFKCLTPEQEKDVDKLITRLVSREEAHIALMELMKWRTEGLDPVYARAVQMKERDPITGKTRLVNPQSSRLVWETYLTEFKSLGRVAVRLIFLRATSCGFKCNWSFLRWMSAKGPSRCGLDRAQKLLFLAAQSKLERRDFSRDDDDRDAELFFMPNGDDDVCDEVVLVDANSA